MENSSLWSSVDRAKEKEMEVKEVWRVTPTCWSSEDISEGDTFGTSLGEARRQGLVLCFSLGLQEAAPCSMSHLKPYLMAKQRGSLCQCAPGFVQHCRDLGALGGLWREVTMGVKRVVGKHARESREMVTCVKQFSVPVQVTSDGNH